MFWFTQGLSFLPLFLVVSSSSTFIVCYIISVFRRDVDVLFPYISDTGANPPESCIFGLMTVISSCAGIATIYARYKFVERLNEEPVKVKPHLNTAALWLGMISCLGMCIVATFQETEVTYVHDGGALMFFLSGVIYIVLQTKISYVIHPPGSSANTFRARVVITIIAIFAFFPSILKSAIKQRKSLACIFPVSAFYKSLLSLSENTAVICAFFVKQTQLHRHKEDKDYPFHVASAVCEWIVAFSFIFFFLTYLCDFQRFTIQVKTEYVEQY
ncbi:DNA damage-regulated autophagy modulator protein 1 isoform X1 [Oryzias latipes]